MLKLTPISISAAKQFVGRHHRHNRPPVGALFAVGVAVAGELCGVATIGRPVARGLQDGTTCEVTRLATTGERNACSMLYGAAARAARALGYRLIYTYTLASEPGTSLIAAGWERVAEVKARGSWSCPSRPRIDEDLFGNRTRPEEGKVKWQKRLAA